MLNKLLDVGMADCLVRPRINTLLADSIRHPLVVVCAGAGYGKTHAVHTFGRNAGIPYLWLQLSQRDNVPSRFWTKYVRATAKWNKIFAEQCERLGFPDTPDKLDRYCMLRRRHYPQRQHLFVLDDAHLVDNPDILRFFERRLGEGLPNSTLTLICREMPDMNLAKMQLKGSLPCITEQDLVFTEDETALYLSESDVSVTRAELHDIVSDTGGWAFAINLIARSLKNAPGYAGYVRAAMRRNIFKLMETEVFDVIGEQLRRFLVRLSLIDHLSLDLITILVDNDRAILEELHRENTFMRYDDGTNAYLFHHLFFDFLRSKQDMLTQNEIEDTYRKAAGWCTANGFATDALLYLEKIGDYRTIVSLILDLPVQMPLDVALCALEIIERAPQACFDEVEALAVMRVRMVVRLGRWNDAIALMREYEQHFKPLPPDDAFRNKTLGALYYCWGNVRALLSTDDDRYDFDEYYAKMAECLSEADIDPRQYADMPIGMWASLVGSSREGAPQDYIGSARRSAESISSCWSSSNKMIDLLCSGELHYYRGEIREAESLFSYIADQSVQNEQYEIGYKALFYLLRIALWRGNRRMAESILKRMEDGLENEGYEHRFFNYDVASAWYHLTLRQPESIPVSLQSTFSPYSHAYFVENHGNQIKARYHYQTREFSPLLAYIAALKQRESILYGRVEMLVLEACTHLQMRERKTAMELLGEAYGQASPNGIVMPFIEMGRDMRTLTATALRNGSQIIPDNWLEAIMRKSASFAKHQSYIISDYEITYGQGRGKLLSKREREVLADLYRGLSRPEIAEKQGLSNNTVNSAVNSVFGKLGAHGIADAVRIAAEERLV